MVPVRPTVLDLKLRAPTIPALPAAKLPDPMADIAQQAQCLLDAAQGGLPFCELYAKP